MCILLQKGIGKVWKALEGTHEGLLDLCLFLLQVKIDWLIIIDASFFQLFVNNMPLLPKHHTHAQQPSTLGLGLLFSSPQKHFDKHKSKTFVIPIGQESKCHHLEAQL
jgi:hypothetical protein